MMIGSSWAVPDGPLNIRLDGLISIGPKRKSDCPAKSFNVAIAGRPPPQRTDDRQMLGTSSAIDHRTGTNRFLRPAHDHEMQGEMMRKNRFAWAVGVAAMTTATAVTAKNWEDWATPVNLESLPGSSISVNTTFVDGCASHSPNGLTIVFNSNRGGNQDIYMAERSSTSEGFGEPVRLPAPVNSSSNEACPTIANGHRLYFSSDRQDPAYDLYVSRLGQDGWSDPERLGPNINVAGQLEEAADFYEDDEGRQVMVFTRRPPGGLAGVGGKLYQSVEGGPASLIQGGPHSSAGDNRASVTNDGLTIFWDSIRSSATPDIYTATRSNTTEPFGDAVRVAALSSPGFEARPNISKDGSFITMSSSRPGSESAAPDIWIASRDKATGNPNN